MAADESEGQGIGQEAAAEGDEHGVGTHRVAHAGARRGERAVDRLGYDLRPRSSRQGRADDLFDAPDAVAVGRAAWLAPIGPVVEGGADVPGLHEGRPHPDAVELAAE